MGTFNTPTESTRSRKYAPGAAKTYEGGAATIPRPEFELRRIVVTYLLGEDTFYESGQSIMSRMESLVSQCSAEFVSNLAIEARERFYLRHTPLFILVEMAKNEHTRSLVRTTAERVIKRADEMGEALAIYWRDRTDNQKKRIPRQLKLAIADAFHRFDEYQLSKYSGGNRGVTIRDAMFLCHPKPKNAEQAAIFKRIAEKELKPADTWERRISSTAGDETAKKTHWTELIENGKLGGLALLRNIRNMIESGISEETIKSALAENKFNRVLPFRFLAAMKNVPHTLEKPIFEAMFKRVQKNSLHGESIILLDASGSMNWNKISTRSDMTAWEVAMGVGVIGESMSETSRVYQYDNDLYAAKGSGYTLYRSLRDEYRGGGTNTGYCAKQALSYVPEADRIIIFTDEQSADRLPRLENGMRGYIINVSSYNRGMASVNDENFSKDGWVRISGFSEAIFDFILEYENLFERNIEG